MAFVFTLEGDGFFIKSVEKADEALITVDIGYDDEDMVTYKVLVALVPIAARPPSCRELYFQIVESTSGGEINDYKSGLSTKAFLTGSDRVSVLHAISQLACHMVEKFGVEILVINTVETYLPHKALVKYDRICAFICDHGYSGGRVDEYHGQEQWQLVKI